MDDLWRSRDCSRSDRFWPSVSWVAKSESFLQHLDSYILRTPFLSNIVKQFHPDVNRDGADSDIMIRRVIEAYEILSNYSRSEIIERECLDPFEKPECEAFDVFVNEVLCVGKGCPYSCVKRASHAFTYASTGTAKASSQVSDHLSSATCQNERFGSPQSSFKYDHSCFCTFCRIRGHSIEYCRKHSRVAKSSTVVSNTDTIPSHPPTPTPDTSSFGKSSNPTYTLTAANLVAHFDMVLSRSQVGKSSNPTYTFTETDLLTLFNMVLSRSQGASSSASFTPGHGEDYQVQLAVGQCPRSCIYYVTPSQRIILEELLESILSTPYDSSAEAELLYSLIVKAKFENNRYQKPKKQPKTSTKHVDWF
ncbi:Chaperone protein DnaJ [Fagus crenata]